MGVWLRGAIVSIDTFLNWGWDPAGTEPRQLRRVRTLTAACLLLILVASPFLIRSIQWHLPLRILILSCAFGCGGLALLMLRRGWYLPAVHSLCLGMYLGGLNQYLTAGGMQSGAVGWWMLVPLLGGLLLGLRTGILWALIPLCSALVLLYFETQGHQFPDLTPPAVRDVQQATRLVGMFLALVVVMIAYLTQIENSERSLAQQNTRLQEQVWRAEMAESEALAAAAAKARFLANMTHELRTPLNSILGFSQRVLKQLDDQLDERQRHGLQLVVENGEQMLQLVSDLLELSSLEAGKLQLGRGAVDLGETLSLLLPELKRIAAGLELQLEAPATLPATLIHGDVARLKYAIDAVLRHGLQFCPSGTVVINVSLQENQPASQYWKLDVHCPNLVFSPEQQQRVFDRYDHLHSVGTRSPLVSGLALVLAREMVRLHDGSLRLESSPAGGTHYRITLPLRGQHKII